MLPDLPASLQAKTGIRHSYDAAVKKENLRTHSMLRKLSPQILIFRDSDPAGHLVRWIYGAKLGEVSESFPIGDKYVVAIVTEINQKGTISLSKAQAND